MICLLMMTVLRHYVIDVLKIQKLVTYGVT